MTLTKLKEDLYIPENFAENHYYFADAKGEKEYTGITTILRVMAKPALIQWAANEAVKYIKENLSYKRMKLLRKGYSIVKNTVLDEASKAHTKKKEAAGAHGTDMHALVEGYIKECISNNAGIPLMALNSQVTLFVEWAHENVDHFLFAERPVHSKSLFLAGTIDFGAVMKDGTRRVGDLKTGSGIYYEAMLQTEAYQVLAEEEGDEKYDGSVIVNLRKDGKFETQTRARNELDKHAFLGLVAAYRGNASFTKPK